MTVKARVYMDGALASPSVSQGFIQLDSRLADFSSNLPIMIIESFGRSIPESLVLGHAHIIPTGEDGRARITDTADFSGRGGFKKRGSSSLSFPKNNYAFEAWNDANEDLDVEFLGLPKESDYILHGPYTDKSLMRNELTFKWANAIGQWAPRTRFIEVYLNQNGGAVGSSDYWGVYVLMEKIKLGEDRVDIARQDSGTGEEPEVTGGYIFKKDRLDPGDSGLRTTRYTVAWVYPKEREATTAQRNWITQWFREYEGCTLRCQLPRP